MFVGIDLGSRFVKIAYGKEESIVKFKKYDTVKFYKNYCINSGSKNLSLDFNKLGFKNIENVVVTGYGKNLAIFKDVGNVTEIEAHSQASMYFCKKNEFILLDIGGQDTKVVHVKNEKIKDFIMNDKCAAGSGRYLENMARLVDLSIDEIGNYYKKPVKLTNTCAIFSESEVISSIVEGIKLEEIASGINYSLFNRIKYDIIKYNCKNVVLTGGVACNKALKYFIEKKLKKNVFVPKRPEFSGAFGCFLNAIKLKIIRFY